MKDRYGHQEVRSYRTAAGTTILYQAPRVLPQAGTVNISERVLVKEGDRLDLAAYKAYGNPLLFYKICDANTAMDPWALLRPGRRLLIPT